MNLFVIQMNSQNNINKKCRFGEKHWKIRKEVDVGACVECIGILAGFFQ